MVADGEGGADRAEEAGARARFRDLEPFALAAQGHELNFYPSGADRLTALLDLIENARSSLKLCFYIFAEDNCGVQVRDALVRAAERGLAVHLMLDSFGSPASETFFRPFIEAGGSYCAFSAKWSRRYLIRNHQKIVIADDKRALVGGFNVEDDYFATPETNGWNDLGVLIEGDAVDDLVRWYGQLEEWTSSDRKQWFAIRRMIRKWDPGEGKVQVLLGGPTRSLSGWARRLNRDLVQAERLDMIMAYFSPPNRMTQRIEDIARCGEVRLVLAGKSDNGATIGATRSLYHDLLKNRAKLWEFNACKLHTKLIVADDAVYFGSANFDMRSLYLNLEIMLRIEDAALADRMRKLVDDQLGGAEEITVASHRARSTLWNRIRWNLSWVLVSVIDYTVSRRLNLGQ